MPVRPAFQHQGPANNCVIAGKKLGWKSCTAYAMAMLIDVATHGEHRPKGARIRKLVDPRDAEGGLTLRQVADVAEEHFGVRVAVRTGANTIPTAVAVKRIRRGRGFLLQGNNEGFGRSAVNHAIWVNEVRGGTPDEPREALVYDPQRQKPKWIPWTKVLRFGATLRLDAAGTRRLGEGRLYAGFPPKPMTPAEEKDLPAPIDDGGVRLRFGARRTTTFPDRTRANPPPGRRVIVRRRPDRMRKRDIVDTLGPNEPFVAYQVTTEGKKPPGSESRVWYGNKHGTEWVHESGLRRIGGPS